MSNVVSITNAAASRSGRRNKSPEDTTASIELERIVESFDDGSNQKHGWLNDAVKSGEVPATHSTGNAETDAAGIALTVNKTADMCQFDMIVFKTTVEFFNKLLIKLDKAQRERVLGYLDKNTATALLMLDYAEKLKAAELRPMVDAALRARGGTA